MRRSNRRTSRKAHQANNMAAENSELFWDIGNFKKTVKRVDDGAVVCDDILRMVNERAEIESKYAKKLTAWEEKWRKQIQNGPMYATMKNAFSGVLSEAQERAKIHVDCYGKLHNQIIESVKSWKTQTFHKHFMGYWKESKEVDDEFTKAQKPWAEGYNKVQRAKRNYHGACKNLETASQGLSAAKTDENFAPEKVKKLEDNVNKQENNVARTKKKYQEKLRRLEPLTISYEAEMKKVFDKCQHMEEKKLKFFQDMLVEYHKCVNVSADERLAKTFKDQLESAKSGDVKHDLIWWAENYGADMPRNWPHFEDYSYDGQCSLVSRWRHKRHCNLCTANKLDSHSDCPADCFSVATINMSLLDAELSNFSLQDLQAVTKVRYQAANNEMSTDSVSNSSSYNMLSSLFDSSSCKEDNSYSVYSDFYRKKEMLVQQFAQNVDEDCMQDAGLLSRSPALETDLEVTSKFDFSERETEPLLTNTSRCVQVQDFHADSSRQSKSSECLLDFDQSNSLKKFSSSLVLGQELDLGRKTSTVDQIFNEPFHRIVVDDSGGREFGLEPGEAEAPVFSENDIGDKTTEVESTYQVPRRQDSNPPSFVPYNGGGNPFSSVSSETGGRSDDEWDEPPPPPDDIPGVPVRALYTYTAVEDDELSFKSGDVLTKLSEEDAQGWCRGRMNGKEGLYPANYVESV